MFKVDAFNMNDLGHAGDLRGSPGGRLCALAGDQHMHVATALGCGCHGVQGGGLDARVVVFGYYE